MSVAEAARTDVESLGFRPREPIDLVARAGLRAALLALDAASVCLILPAERDERPGEFSLYRGNRDAGGIRREAWIASDDEAAFFARVARSDVLIAGSAPSDAALPGGRAVAGASAFVALRVPRSDGIDDPGVVVFSRDEPRPFTARDLPVARDAASAVATILEQSYREATMQQQLEALARAIAAGGTEPDGRGWHAAVAVALRGVLAATDAGCAAVHVISGRVRTHVARLPVSGALEWTASREALVAGGTDDELRRTKQPVLVPDAAPRLSLHADACEHGARSSVHVPVVVGGELVGSLNAAWARPHRCTPEHATQLGRLSAHLAIAFDHLRQREDLERTIRELATVADTTAAIAAAPGLEEALRALIDGMRALTGAASGGVRLLAGAGLTGPCRLYAWHGDERYEWLAVDNVEGSNTVRVLTNLHGEYTADVLVDHLHDDLIAREADATTHPARSSLIVPIRSGGRVIGTLHADSLQQNAFGSELLVPLQVLADQAGGAVARAQLLDLERNVRERLAAALVASSTLVYTSQLDGTIDAVEGNVESLVGFSADELVGRPILDLVHPDARAACASLVEPWRRDTREVRRIETAVVHGSGRSVPVLIATGPRREDGHIVGSAGAITDLSAIKQLQAERDAALEAHARADGAVRTGRAVAHELGSPLSTMLALTELLVDDPRLPEDVNNDLLALRGEADRAASLLHKFGRIARYEEMTTPAGPQLDVGRAAREAPAARDAS